MTRTSTPRCRAFRGEVFEADFAKSRELQDEIAVDWSDHLSDSLLNPF